jgi:hypothetical protein
MSVYEMPFARHLIGISQASDQPVGCLSQGRRRLVFDNVIVKFDYSVLPADDIRRA